MVLRFSHRFERWCVKNTIGILILIAGLAVNSYAGALDTWTNVATSPYGSFNNLVYGNGYYVANSATPPVYGTPPPVLTGGISVSTNGFNWVHQPVYDEEFSGLVFGNNEFVLFSDSASEDNGVITYSSNGTNWQSLILPSLSGIAFGNGVFAGVGYNSTSNKGMAFLSTNGQTWNTNGFVIATNFSPAGIAFGQGGFVVIGGLEPQKTNYNAYFSTNGQTWTNIPLTLNGTFVGIYSVNNIFIAAAYTNIFNINYYANTNLSSPWAPIAVPLPCVWLPVGENNSLYASFNSVSNLYSSSAYNTNWITNYTGFTNTFNCLAYANGRFLAAGSGGGIFISGVVPPSISILKQTNSGAELTISGGAGPTCHLQASTNLANWTNLAAFTNIGVSAQYLDSAAGGFTQRYYRTVSP